MTGSRPPCSGRADTGRRERLRHRQFRRRRWTYDLDFDWPVQKGVLAVRVLEVTAQAVGSHTVFRVDATTTWVPPRDPATFIPASTSAVTITYGSR